MSEQISDWDRRFITIIKKLDGVTTARELSRRVWMCRRAAVAKATLEGLVDRGHGRWIDAPSGPRGGRPLRYFKLNDSASPPIQV